MKKGLLMPHKETKKERELREKLIKDVTRWGKEKLKKYGIEL